ncbi:MAG: hypothetical protein WBO86_10550, partial [Blautia wexlerae]
VRLCHKLGLEGYGDFKIKYSAELQFDLAHTDRIDPSLEVITIFFRTTFKPFLSICRFYRLFLYF